MCIESVYYWPPRDNSRNLALKKVILAIGNQEQLSLSGSERSRRNWKKNLEFLRRVFLTSKFFGDRTSLDQRTNFITDSVENNLFAVVQFSKIKISHLLPIPYVLLLQAVKYEYLAKLFKIFAMKNETRPVLFRFGIPWSVFYTNVSIFIRHHFFSFMQTSMGVDQYLSVFTQSIFCFCYSLQMPYCQTYCYGISMDFRSSQWFLRYVSEPLVGAHSLSHRAVLLVYLAVQ